MAPEQGASKDRQREQSPMPLDEAQLNNLPPESQLWVLRGPNGKEVTIPHAAYPGTAVVYAFLSQIDAQTILDKIPADAPLRRFSPVAPAAVQKGKFIADIIESRENGEDIGFAVLTPNEVFDFWWPKG